MNQSELVLHMKYTIRLKAKSFYNELFMLLRSEQSTINIEISLCNFIQYVFLARFLSLSFGFLGI